MASSASDPQVRTVDASPPLASVEFGRLPPCPHPLRHPLRALGWLVTVASGLVSLVAILAVLAAIPVVNFLALGYLLEAEGRVVRSGRFRDGMPFAGALPRLGAVALGVWFWLAVVRLVALAAADAALVDPGGPAATRWAALRGAVTCLVGSHVALALFAGGGLAAFFRPLRNLRLFLAACRNGQVWRGTAAGLAHALDVIRPGRLFSLGVRGFIGGFVWIAIPTILFASLRETRRPGQVLVVLLGGGLLAVVLSWVPFLQARFAAENRLAAFRDVGAVREAWRRAPVAMFLAVVVLYAASLPLPLFKVLAPPRDVVPFLTPIFVLTIYPARLVVARATAWAATRPARRWLVVRAAVGLALVPLFGFYLFLLFFTPAIDALGRRVLFDHHALLLPSPF